MEHFKFPERHSVLLNSMQKISRLSTIPDTECNAKPPTLSLAVKEAVDVPVRDIRELLSLDLSRDAIPLPHRRVVFLSIAQLNASIESIPSYILKNALLCFRAERSWFFPSNPVEQSKSFDSIRHQMSFCDKFLRTLAQKEADGLALWLQHDTTWHHISAELARIEDLFYRETAGLTMAAGGATKRGHHRRSSSSVSTEQHIEQLTTSQPVSGKEGDRNETVSHLTRQITVSDSNLADCYSRLNVRKYEPLRLDPQWWTGRAPQDLQFAATADAVVAELRSNALKFSPSMEILFESNPTLVPMTGFDLKLFVDHHYAAAITAKQVAADRAYRDRPRDIEMVAVDENAPSISPQHPAGPRRASSIFEKLSALQIVENERERALKNTKDGLEGESQMMTVGGLAIPHNSALLYED